ncbi:MAG: hypothetical protein E7544_01820 [Ruminococcaceae bacterium]|nr:hypothetical protein [Oscillospiraceae bacterium]
MPHQNPRLQEQACRALRNFQG